MSTIPSIHPNPEHIGLTELLAYAEKAVPSGSTGDSFSLALHRERMRVAGAYAHEYLDRCGRRPSILEFAGLDGDRVAAVIAPDLDRKGQTGIANAVAALVEHARELLDATVVTAEDIVSTLPREWNISTRWEPATPNAEPTGGHSLPSCIHITIALSGSGPGDTPSGEEPTGAPR